MKSKEYFSTFELSVIKSLIERKPKKKELDLIGKTLYPIILRKDLFDFSTKFSFKDIINYKSFLSEDGLSIISSSTSEIDILNMLLEQFRMEINLSCISIDCCSKNTIATINNILQEYLSVVSNNEFIIINKIN